MRLGLTVSKKQKQFIDATEDEVLEVIEKTILFFRDQGVAGERLADTVARVGFAEAERLLLSDELLLRKAEILSAPLK